MRKKFNITGVCVPERHYMVDTSHRIDSIVRLIEQDEYFTINRGRQYGKTTTLLALWKRLREEYIFINISFEGIGSAPFQNESSFVSSFTRVIYDRLMLEKARNKSGTMNVKCKMGQTDIPQLWLDAGRSEDPGITYLREGSDDTFESLRRRITRFCRNCRGEVILTIDEVDKFTNNQVFLGFLGMLRDMYLQRDIGLNTFKSVILAGVYDIRNMKKKLRPDEETQYNSPWNIAMDFDIDMSFHTDEIEQMLAGYENDNHMGMNTNDVAEEIYFYTSGYPYLVSAICKRIDESNDKCALQWNKMGVRLAVRNLLMTTNPLFDDITKNYENNRAFAEVVRSIIVDGRSIGFVRSQPEIELGAVFSVFTEKNGKVAISNIIFETLLLNHILANDEVKGIYERTPSSYNFITRDGRLDMKLIMTKFGEMMKSEYHLKDESFLEREGRYLFLFFIRPIINGMGHYVVEPQTRNDARMDVMVFYGNEEFVIELKVWHGPKKNQDGIEQLVGYLDSQSIDRGYLVSFCRNKGSERIVNQYSGESFVAGGKEIFELIV